MAQIVSPQRSPLDQGASLPGAFVYINQVLTTDDTVDNINRDHQSSNYQEP